MGSPLGFCVWKDFINFDLTICMTIYCARLTHLLNSSYLRNLVEIYLLENAEFCCSQRGLLSKISSRRVAVKNYLNSREKK